MTQTAPEQPEEAKSHSEREAEAFHLPTQTELDPQYPWVRAWGQLNGYNPEAILAQQREALRFHAPGVVCWHNRDAIEWVSLLDIWPEAYETRLWFLDWAHSRDIELPYEVLKVWLDPYARMRP